MGLYNDKFLAQSINPIQEELRKRSEAGENINLPLLMELEAKGKQRRTLLRWMKAVSDGKITIAEDLVVKTKSGYPLDEVVSALQKDIRRGNFENACYWARELVLSGNGWKLWRRLQVVALEDIGMANPLAIVVIRSLRDQAMEFGVDTWDGQRSAIAGGFYLATSKKSRLMDELTNYYEYLDKGKIEVEKPIVPKYSIDCHTKAGRRQGLSWPRPASVQQWYSESSLLENEVEIVPDEKKFLKALMVADGFIGKETVQSNSENNQKNIINKIIEIVKKIFKQ